MVDVKKLVTDGSGASSSAGIASNADHIVYITRASLENMRAISQQIQHALKTSTNRSQYHIYYIPFHTVICEQILEDEHVLSYITTVGEFSIGLIPLDSDLLSLEMPDMFKQCYVDGDTATLNVIAHSLHKMQTLYGIIPQVKAKGAASKKILQKMLQLRKQHQNSQNGGRNQAVGGSSSGGGSNNTRSCIDTVVVLDREVDLVTPLTTPLTYEGLIDELIGIEYGKASVDASVIGDIADPKMNIPGVDEANQPPPPPKPTYQPGDKVALVLNNSDPIYSDIRDVSIERLGVYMQEKAINIRRTYNSFRENKDASLQEIADFVKKIPGITREYKLLHTHINVAELLKRTTDSREFRDYWQAERGIMDGDFSSSSSGASVSLDLIEELISADIDRLDFFHVLRLFCLQSLCSGGIRKNYDALKKMIVQTYGYQHIFTLYNLERSGFLRRKESKSNVGGLGSILDSSTNSSWHLLKKNLNLIADDADNGYEVSGFQSDIDISYVAAGYAPLSVRLVQAAAQPKGWGSRGKEVIETMKLLPGPMVEFSQFVDTIDADLDDALARYLYCSICIYIVCICN